MAALRVVEPEVPVTVTVEVPMVAVAEAVRVRVELVLPLAGGVTEAGANEAVTPLGRPEAESATAELNPLRLVTVIVLVPLLPWTTLRLVGEAETEKSGVGAAPPPPNLKDALPADPLKPPEALSHSSADQKKQSSGGGKS